MDDLLIAEGKNEPSTASNVILYAERRSSFQITRHGFRRVYGAKPGEYDRLAGAGKIANAHFFEQAEAKRALVRPVLEKLDFLPRGFADNEDRELNK